MKLVTLLVLFREMISLVIEGKDNFEELVSEIITQMIVQ